MPKKTVSTVAKKTKDVVVTPTTSPTILPRLADNEYHEIIKHLPFLQRFKEIIRKKRTLPFRDTLIQELVRDPKYIPTRFIIKHKAYPRGLQGTQFLYTNEVQQPDIVCSTWNDFITELKKHSHLFNENYSIGSDVTVMVIENDLFSISFNDECKVIVIRNKQFDKFEIHITAPSIERLTEIKEHGTTIKEFDESKDLRMVHFYIKVKKVAKSIDAALVMDMFAGFYWAVKYLNINTVSPDSYFMARVVDKDYDYYDNETLYTLLKEFVDAAKKLVIAMGTLPYNHYMKQTNNNGTLQQEGRKKKVLY